MFTISYKWGSLLCGWNSLCRVPLDLTWSLILFSTLLNSLWGPTLHSSTPSKEWRGSPDISLSSAEVWIPNKYLSFVCLYVYIHAFLSSNLGISLSPPRFQVLTSTFSICVYMLVSSSLSRNSFGKIYILWFSYLDFNQRKINHQMNQMGLFGSECSIYSVTCESHF